MATATYYHLKAADYSQSFPAALDDFPVLIQKRTYIDAWIYNFLFAAIVNIQQFVIDNKTAFER